MINEMFTIFIYLLNYLALEIFNKKFVVIYENNKFKAMVTYDCQYNHNLLS